MTIRERAKHDHAMKAMIVIHDGVCGSPESRVRTQSQDLAKILLRLPERFAMLDACECGCPIWAAIVQRNQMSEVIRAVETELPNTATVLMAGIEWEWQRGTSGGHVT